MCLIVIALAWVLALAAEAQPIKEGPAARQHAATAPSRLGVDFYRAGYYASALVKLEAAYGLREAIDYEERWLLAAGASLSTKETHQARGRLLRLRDLERQPQRP